MADPRVDAIETNVRGFFEAVSDGTLARRDPDVDVISFHTGVPFPLCNGAVMPTFAAGEEARRTREVLERADARGVPYLWNLTPATAHPEIVGVLTDHGMLRQDSPGMYVDPRTVAPTREPDGVHVHVVDHSEMPTHIDLMLRGFEMPEFLREPLLAMFGDLPPEIAHVVRATLHDEPVAIGMLVDVGGVTGLYNITTLDSARGLGVGYAVTNRLVDIARELGREHCVLMATELGYPIYERLGFVTVCEVSQFVGDPSS